MHRRQNPTGQSLFLLLSACGVSSTPDRGDSFVMGRVFGDRHVAGARVYVDVNNNHQFDEGIDHYIGTTDQNGTYHGEIPLEHRGKPLLADLTDARDLSAPTIKLSGIWRAPEGSKIISPMTELLVALDKNSEEILNLLNLDSDIDLTIYDPFSDGEPDPTDQQVIEIDPNLVLKLIKAKHQLEEKINDLSAIVSIFDAANVIKIAVPENQDRKIALHTFTPPPGLTGGTFELTDGYIDNHLFTIDENTGALHVKNFQNRRGTYTFDYENPHDSNYDNTYDIEAVYRTPDKTRHATQFEITVTDGAEDPKFYYSNFNALRTADHPVGDVEDIKYILRGEAFIMPLTGPVQITWGLDLRDGYHGLKNDGEIKTATALIEQAIAEFEAAANIDFVKSTLTDPDDFDIPFRIYNNPVSFNNADNDIVSMYSPLTSNPFYDSLVHEIGHTLGLHHIDEGLFQIPSSREWGEKTVMAAFRDRAEAAKTKIALRSLDKKALEFLYGAKNTDFDDFFVFFHI